MRASGGVAQRSCRDWSGDSAILEDVVVVDQVRVFLVVHQLQVPLHLLQAQELMRVHLVEPVPRLFAQNVLFRQLVPQRHPPRHAVLGTPEQLDFTAAWVHPLDQPVNLVRLSTCFPDLGHDHIAVQLCIYLGLAFDAHQAVFFRVVQPVPRLACNDQPLDLVCLDPDQLVDLLIPPLLHAVPS